MVTRLQFESRTRIMDPGQTCLQYIFGTDIVLNRFPVLWKWHSRWRNIYITWALQCTMDVCLKRKKMCRFSSLYELINGYQLSIWLNEIENYIGPQVLVNCLASSLSSLRSILFLRGTGTGLSRNIAYPTGYPLAHKSLRSAMCYCVSVTI